MTSPFSSRDVLRLKNVHPTLIYKLGIIFTDMARKGHAMFVVSGARTAEEQAELYKQGRTKPGPIVTNKDGYIRKSNHQTHADGLGHAIDCAFLGGDPFAESHPWSLYGEAGEAEGLIWGGRWVGLVDRPHLELPDLA